MQLFTYKLLKRIGKKIVERRKKRRVNDED
jgi:hypothetical protein